MLHRNLAVTTTTGLVVGRSPARRRPGIVSGHRSFVGHGVQPTSINAASSVYCDVHSFSSKKQNSKPVARCNQHHHLDVVSNLSPSSSSSRPLAPMEGRRLQSQQRRCFSSSFSGGNQSSPRKKDFDYCIDLVQNRDRESYLCGLLLPYEARKAYFAVRAYNVELASIKGGSVSRQVGGAQFADESGANLALKVRTQWWRDAIQQIYTEDGNNDDDNNNINPTAGSTEDDDAVFFASMATSYYKNPVVRVLHHAVHDKHLTRRFLERLLEAREMDLDVRQPGTIRDMVQYSDNIFSSLLYLSLETVNVRNEDADIMAQHAGIGIGLVTALRGARIRLSGGEFAIPQELIPTQFPYHKLYNLNDDLRVELSDEEHRMLKGAVEEICAVAHAHFSIVQESLKRQDVIPKHARPCFLPMIPAMHYLSKLEKANFDIFDDSLLVQDHLTILYKLTRSWLTGTV